MLLYTIFLLYKKSHVQHPPPRKLSGKVFADLPFNVKAQTRIPKEFADPRIARQLLPTMSVSSYLYV